MKKIYVTLITMLVYCVSFGQAGVIVGPSEICFGNTASMTDSIPGGIWSVSMASLATISTGGIVTGVSAGVVTISYAVGGAVATHVLTLDPMPTPTSGPSTVCAGSTGTYTCGTPGGSWSVSTTAVATIDPATGVLTGITPGVDVISYTIGVGCAATSVVTISATSAPIVGSTSACLGSTASLSDPVPGGTWSSSNPVVASVDAYGIVTTHTVGTTIISYASTGSCGAGTATVSFTVNPLPSVITAPTFLCVGASAPVSDSVPGGVWTTSSSAVLSISFLGSVTGVSFGVATITYVTPAGCATTAAITVTPALPLITPTVHYGVCNGGIDTLVATCTGATSFLWSPATGVACSSCGGITTTTSSSDSMYTVTASDGFGCASTATISVDVNRIMGHILYGSGMPTVPDTKIWLIQYNPADSSLTALDSTVSCMDGSAPFYQFNDKVSGDYLVKAKLLSSITGTSDYIPTYGLSNAHWDTATTIFHAGGANTQDINMIYGTVPSGPGFIGGLIVMGAGKGTSGEVPAPNLLVYLEDASGNVLTYTYTDASGAFSFSGIGYGTYVIYPTDYKYRTTPSDVITLNTTTSSYTAVDFKKHTTLGTITPFAIVTGVNQLPGSAVLTLSPNPAGENIQVNWNNQPNGVAHISFTDMAGRVVYNNSINMATRSGNVTLQPVLANGQYFVRVYGETINWTGRLTVTK